MLIRTGANICLTVHMKSTPLRKPRKSGGSPKGVRPPPMFATRKMKKMTMCTRRVRFWLAFSSGRIISIAAPVVPMIEASAVPTASRAVLSLGVPFKSPQTKMPPEMVYRASSSRMKGMYSSTSACATVWIPADAPKTKLNGMRKSNVQKAVILP
ncbi:Uncharacterised protein [Neisseria meningitidis]|nr:Uncharacterised protein [Neisseria meningitidis]CWP16953.1 Uncharacterised protein [Neisseria meningitidis]CWS07688.1 Uncharacterised protein [Neisseria meningitidis]CWT68944.1 Uncharacterised protein [Neisseria meningitidis]CWU31582.1 Uncharacterised protein [Neisseria meningitidis]